jgi:hypothetical protein
MGDSTLTVELVSDSPAPCHVRGMGTVPRLVSWVHHLSTHWHRSGGNVAVGRVDGGGSKERGGGGGGSGRGWSRKM